MALAAINATPEPRNHIVLPLKREALTSDVCITVHGHTAGRDCETLAMERTPPHSL
jgi:hypothetical protein